MPIIDMGSRASAPAVENLSAPGVRSTAAYGLDRGEAAVSGTDRVSHRPLTLVLLFPVGHDVPMTDEPQVTVTDNPEESRFEVSVDGTLAGFAAYQRDPGTVIFVHTEVFEEYEGQGLAGQLAKAALGMVRDAGDTIVPMCPYIRAYVRKHAPEYDDLLRPHAPE